MAKKRKTLPKDFAEILKRGDIQEIINVFDKCEIDAYGGYGKMTAIAFPECPPELDKWLVAKGLDIEAINDYGYTPLQHRAGYWSANIESLIYLGADININNKNGTALHCAAKRNITQHVKTLVEYGADVNALAPEPFSYGNSKNTTTALEYSLASCGNIHIANASEIAKILLDAGARKTEKMKELVTKIGTTFEFHRSGFNREHVQKQSDALDELYTIFEVTPVPQRILHDGKSKITVKANTWDKQFEEIWELLVPSSRAAQTMQGEVIRIAGRISDELSGNGGINWDNDFKAMADTFLVFIQQGEKLPVEEIDIATKIVFDVKRKIDTNVDLLAEYAVKWVLKNPIPTDLPPISYNR